MNQEPQGSGGLRTEGYHVARLDDVSTRLARVEGRMDSLATKEDVSNAKLHMLLSWIGIAIAILVGAASVILRFWPMTAS